MKKDLTGQQFGRLVVIEDSQKRKNGSVVWKCICTCGLPKYIAGRDLLSGHTRSCGCLQKEKAKKFLSELPKVSRAKGRSSFDEKYRKENTSLNLLKQKKRKDNTSGVKGVSFQKKSGKYVAYIYFRSNRIHLGLFADKQDAINARKEAEEKYFKPILEKYKK